MEVVDLDKAKQLVRDAARRHPNRRNPQYDGACVYTGAGGSSHCIAGQVFADLGLPVPGPEVGCGLDDLPATWGDFADLPSKFTGPAWAYLCKAQYVFDGGIIKSGGLSLPVHPRRWRAALALLEKHGDDLDVNI